MVAGHRYTTRAGSAASNITLERTAGSHPLAASAQRAHSANIKEEFQRLAAEWEKATAYHSSTTVRNNDPAYQKIIGLGPAVEGLAGRWPMADFPMPIDDHHR